MRLCGHCCFVAKLEAHGSPASRSKPVLTLEGVVISSPRKRSEEGRKAGLGRIKSPRHAMGRGALWALAIDSAFREARVP